MSLAKEISVSSEEAIDPGDVEEIDVVSMDTKSSEEVKAEVTASEQTSPVVVAEPPEDPTTPQDTDPQCYCNRPKEGLMLQCDMCKRRFHMGCLKTGNPSTLDGDSYFTLRCEGCSHTHEEVVARMKLTWQQVVILALYNLGLKKSGRKGFFRWKEDICEFISQHWTLIFGNSKAKTQTWHGTVAGVLSVSNKSLFKSGVSEFGEAGWWSLIEMKPPELKPEVPPGVGKQYAAGRKTKVPFEPTIKVEGLRNRKRGTSVESAIELKEKRSRTQEAKDIRRAKQAIASEELTKKVKLQRELDIDDSSMDSFGSESFGLPPSVPDSPSVLSLLGGDNSSDFLLSNLLNESDLTPAETIPSALMAGDEEEFIPPSKGIPLFRIPTPVPSSQGSNGSTATDKESEADKDGEPKAVPGDTRAETVSKALTRRSKAAEVRADEKPEEGPKYLPMSVYEEKQLLRVLESCSQAVDKNPAARRLRRKLLVRQEKRNLGLPLFDLDATVQQILQRVTGIKPTSISDLLLTQSPLRHLSPSKVSSSHDTGDYRILDRFQMPNTVVRAQQRHHTSFRARLVGCDEVAMMQSIISPYTSRVLKPFIRRDYESRPTKLRLMGEIMQHRKQCDPSFTPQPLAPIDYCYLRPQHIPSVNSLCREFFWPGIDLSECLQYPDFSVVVLYRKVVIGFGFMVPDVKFNEAYISFLFVHPEWRGVGIGTFMVYHLIQTCMGKDVTLHVSATNSAMLLYQKFGFKPEEFILDFYEKYYPQDSRECRHAFFLRLRR
ncbi:cysteine-rich protein 2-binding protein-like [Acanthaster planci]|uniref:Cysteine-rich protein 2-binding protein-like n=1 Tax=Acanthaster planci TaxID=133434 RepID=A0A8B7Y559_ACAPL|nr:cysteine-rich protein 2-binding protein-like [Acanthaster planci]XP_022087678.1 cysteine-rich protein 2-binding protein-like [Acanthaster planci]